MQDTQWHDILRDYVEADEPASGLSIGDISTAIRRSRRRRGLTAAMAGTVAAGAVAVAVVVAVGQPAAKPEVAPTANASAAPAMLDAAYVQSSIVTALGSSSDLLVREKASSRGVLQFTITEDRKTGRTRMDTDHSSDGVPDESDLIIPGTPDSTWLDVDYQSRTWSTTAVRFDSTNHVRLTPYADPAQIRDAVKNGSITVVGHEVIDGQKTLHLTLNTTGPTSKPSAIELWVDATTYLPVQEKAGAHLNNGAPGLTISYTWLPRTKANLATIDLKPPADFTEIPGAAPNLPPPTDQPTN